MPRKYGAAPPINSPSGRTMKTSSFPCQRNGGKTKTKKQVVTIVSCFCICYVQFSHFFEYKKPRGIRFQAFGIFQKKSSTKQLRS